MPNTRFRILHVRPNLPWNEQPGTTPALETTLHCRLIRACSQLTQLPLAFLHVTKGNTCNHSFDPLVIQGEVLLLPPSLNSGQQWGLSKRGINIYPWEYLRG